MTRVHERVKRARIGKGIVVISFFSSINMSCFTKRSTKTTSAPPMKLLVELKPKRATSLVKLSCTKQSHSQFFSCLMQMVTHGDMDAWTIV